MTPRPRRHRNPLLLVPAVRSEEDEYVPVSPYTGTVADLTLYEEPESGLVDVNGNPIPRRIVPGRRIGFLPPAER